MDAVRMLTEDHRLFRALVARYRAARTEQEQEELARRLVDEARTHIRLEEQYVYPVARHRMGATLDEHFRGKALLAELEQLSFKDDRFDHALRAFADELLSHSGQEERLFFPVLRKAMQRGELGALGRLMQNAREARAGEPAASWSRVGRHLLKAWKAQVGNTWELLYSAVLGGGVHPHS